MGFFGIFRKTKATQLRFSLEVLLILFVMLRHEKSAMAHPIISGCFSKLYNQPALPLEGISNQLEEKPSNQ
jgi:hypothetical protein